MMSGLRGILTSSGLFTAMSWSWYLSLSLCLSVSLSVCLSVLSVYPSVCLSAHNLHAFVITCIYEHVCIHKHVHISPTCARTHAHTQNLVERHGSEAPLGGLFKKTFFRYLRSMPGGGGERCSSRELQRRDRAFSFCQVFFYFQIFF